MRKFELMTGVPLPQSSMPQEEVSIGENEPDGMFSQTVCSSTHRVAVISSFPDRLHGLIRTISTGCFDILLFRRLDSFLGNVIFVDVYILDLTHTGIHDIHGMEAFVSQPERSARTLFLVKDRLQRRLDHPFIDQSHTLSWPAGMHEVMYALQRVLRESQATVDGSAATRYTYKDLSVDPKKMAVYRSSHQIELTKTEYDILLRLLESNGAVLTREEIMNRVWGSQFVGGSNVVDVHVKSLRKKLGDKAEAPTYIVTVRGAGYRLADH